MNFYFLFLRLILDCILLAKLLKCKQLNNFLLIFSWNISIKSIDFCIIIVIVAKIEFPFSSELIIQTIFLKIILFTIRNNIIMYNTSHE